MGNRVTYIIAPMLLSAFFGAAIGAIAGALYGSFFFPLIGTAYGFMYGGLGGWVAGLLGVIINHHMGYKIGGLVAAILCNLAVFYPATEREALAEAWQYAILIAISVLIGWRVDKDMYGDELARFDLIKVISEGSPTSGARPYRWLRSMLRHSELVKWSLRKRLGWATILLGLHFCLYFYFIRHHSL